MSLCFLCKTPLVDQSKHRECLLKGLEEGLVQSKADWLKKSKPKVRKMIRKVLIKSEYETPLEEQPCDTTLPKSVCDPNQSIVSQSC
jgi:hypothetical protein